MDLSHWLNSQRDRILERERETESRMDLAQWSKTGESCEVPAGRGRQKWSTLTQAELRELLHALGLATDGTKSVLVARLSEHLQDQPSGPSAAQAAELSAIGVQTALVTWQEEAVALGNLQVQHALQVVKVKTAKAAAYAVATRAKAQHNENACELFQLLAHEDVRGAFLCHAAWGVVGLWRLRAVSRTMRCWATAQLEALPRVVAVGGMNDCDEDGDSVRATAGVEALDLSTMRWSTARFMPSLPEPRSQHVVSSFADGRTVVCAGKNEHVFFEDANNDSDNEPDREDWDEGLHLAKTALQWVPGSTEWVALPDLPGNRLLAASVSLPDGRTMLIGGYDNTKMSTLASVIVLAADGSEWSELPPMRTQRFEAAAVVMPDGKVLVAGGALTKSVNRIDLKTSELWDPATQAWTALPDMATKRRAARACVLPSGRVAVVGGTADQDRSDGEMYDSERGVWEPLPGSLVEGCPSPAFGCGRGWVGSSYWERSRRRA